MTYQELIYSDTAIANNINNSPRNLQHIYNLQQLCGFLDSLEKLLDVKINVNSGYRVPELNKLVGGASNSLHMYGLAADIKVKDSGKCTLTDLKNLCKELRKTRLSEIVVHDTYVHIAIKPYC